MLVQERAFGPYKLVKRLGAGGFGEVWLAEKSAAEAGTTFRYAVKIATDEGADPESFRKEVSAWVTATGHPNVLPVVDAVMYEGVPAIVTEYAAEGSLADWMKKNCGTARKRDEILSIAMGILAGLAHLHSRNILHRDLKPSNILLQGGVPRIADFGLARVLSSTKNASHVAGTPVYMAPEAFDGHRSVQTDIWAVGVILYQLVENRLPYPQNTPTEILKAMLTRDPEELSPATPEVLKKIVRKALQRDFTLRYASAAEMLADLRKAAVELSAADNRTRTLPAGMAPATLNAHQFVATVQDCHADRMNNRQVAAAAGAAALPFSVRACASAEANAATVQATLLAQNTLAARAVPFRQPPATDAVRAEDAPARDGSRKGLKRAALVALLLLGALLYVNLSNGLVDSETARPFSAPSAAADGSGLKAEAVRTAESLPVSATAAPAAGVAGSHPATVVRTVYIREKARTRSDRRDNGGSSAFSPEAGHAVDQPPAAVNAGIPETPVYQAPPDMGPAPDPRPAVIDPPVVELPARRPAVVEIPSRRPVDFPAPQVQADSGQNGNESGSSSSSNGKKRPKPPKMDKAPSPTPARVVNLARQARQAIQAIRSKF